jgi:hypothetical protein
MTVDEAMAGRPGSLEVEGGGVARATGRAPAARLPDDLTPPRAGPPNRPAILVARRS